MNIATSALWEVGLPVARCYENSREALSGLSSWKAANMIGRRSPMT